MRLCQAWRGGLRGPSLCRCIARPPAQAGTLSTLLTRPLGRRPTAPAAAADPSSVALPPIKISWLKKFDTDDFFQAEVRNASGLGVDWATAAVEEISAAGLFHQHHYSNFYHMFSEVAPSIHHVLCKYLHLCAYDPASPARVVFIQQKRPDIPAYTMLDSIADTFRCLTPHPVQHKDDAALKDKVPLSGGGGASGGGAGGATLVVVLVVMASCWWSETGSRSPQPPAAWAGDGSGRQVLTACWPTALLTRLPLPLQVLVLRRAVVGVSPEIRVFHNWEKDLRENWREPPKGAMLLWRQRVADCFGFNFTQVRCRGGIEGAGRS